MTYPVVVAPPDTGYKELIDILAGHGISAVPIVDEGGKVVGVVSEADLLHKLELPPDHAYLRLVALRRRGSRAKADAHTAAGLMTSPVITIRPDALLGEAARVMEHHEIKRLPVIDDGRLVGIVSRRDLLRSYLRSDADLRRDVLDNVVWRMLTEDPTRVEVTVTGGVVTLRGTADRRSSADLTVRLTRAMDGVIDVDNQLGWAYDDSEEINRRYLFDARID